MRETRTRLADLSYWLGRLKVQANDAESLSEWKKRNNEPAYDVLSQPVRHELNKFFYDVCQNPSKAERKQLWYDLQLIDPLVRLSKIVRWFQNKRQYIKRQYGRPLQTESSSSSSSADPRQLKSGAAKPWKTGLGHYEKTNEGSSRDTSDESSDDSIDSNLESD